LKKYLSGNEKMSETKIIKTKKKRKYKRCIICGKRVKKTKGFKTAVEALRFHITKEHPDFMGKRVSITHETAHLTERTYA
jgi:hypothetical protein